MATMTLADLEATLSAAEGIPGCRIVVREMCGAWGVARANLWDPARKIWVKDGAIARMSPQGWFVYPRFRSWEAQLLGHIPGSGGAAVPLIETAIKHGSAEWEVIS